MQSSGTGNGNGSGSGVEKDYGSVSTFVAGARLASREVVLKREERWVYDF